MRKRRLVIISCFFFSAGGGAWGLRDPVTVSSGTQTPALSLLQDNPAQANQQVPLNRAGDAAWRRLVNDERREWEGDVEGLALWRFRNYGGFLEQYPLHPRAGDALFKVAEATWARGGYPEVFHYIFATGTWDEWKAKAQHLEQWFDTRGFGGGPGGIVANQDPKQAVQARTLFLEVLAKYPFSQSAPMAAYYSAVILDYCLNDSRQAVVEYEAFVRKYPRLRQFAEKASRRIVTLRERR